MKLWRECFLAAIILITLYPTLKNSLVLAADSYQFPNDYVPAKYISGGWQEETHISQSTDSTGTALVVQQGITFQPTRMRGVSYPAETGRLIYKVEFNYEANYDTGSILTGLDYLNKPLFWTAPTIGANQFASIDLPGVPWVSLGLYISNTVTNPAPDWHLKIWNVKIYYTPSGGNLRVSPSQGGAITYLELNGNNLVDTNDCGRLVQVDFGDGSQTTDLCSAVGQATPWNPTQACDSNACGPHLTGSSQVIFNSADVTGQYGNATEINGENTTIVSNKFLNWVRNGERADYILKQTTRKTQYSNIFSLDFELTNLGDTTHSRYISIDLPVAFLKSSLTDRFISYVGNSPWQNGPLTEWVNFTPSQWGPGSQPQDPYGRITNTTERWTALANASHDGVVLYYPPQPTVNYRCRISSRGISPRRN